MTAPRKPLTALLRSAEGWLAFRNPVSTRTATTLDDVIPLITEVEQAAQKGLHAVLAISYEASPAFDAALKVHPSSGTPLVWAAFFDKVERGIPDALPIVLNAWTSSESLADYTARIQRIRDLIASGDTYQVNYTFPLHGQFDGDPLDLFLRLADAQRAPHSAFIDAGDFAICSASPELFFTKSEDTITCQPMKGTTTRGLTLEDDEAHARALALSEKNRAENIMIVDMVRNDLGRIAIPGTVRTTSLFDVTRFPTIWQMTSTVEAKSKAGLCDILKALFPSASVTGAPKVRTMEIIRELETGPRGFYTGTIGHVSPDGHMHFNVAIRTAVIDKKSGQATYGIGSGIVWDSNADSEYAECLAKSRILEHAPEPVSLFETIRWTKSEGFFLLENHLMRLRASCAYFDIPCNFTAIQDALNAASKTWTTTSLRVRLVTNDKGQVTIDTAALPPPSDKPWKLAFAKEPVDSTNPRLYHKTTNRQIYEDAKKSVPGVDDVILWNERGEVTESTIANIIVEIEGKKWTPQLSSGLLPGILRQHLLTSGEIEENILTREDLKNASRIFLVNALRGWIEATL